MRRLLTENSALKVWHEHDEKTDATTIVHEYKDVDAVLELNKKLANEDNAGWNQDRTMVHVARIPEAIQVKWLLEEGLDIFNKEHWPRLRQKLNDPDWRYLRTSPIRV